MVRKRRRESEIRGGAALCGNDMRASTGPGAATSSTSIVVGHLAGCQSTVIYFFSEVKPCDRCPGALEPVQKIKYARQQCAPI